MSRVFLFGGGLGLRLEVWAPNMGPKAVLGTLKRTYKDPRVKGPY